MKLSVAFLSLAYADVCDDCNGQINDFNEWINNERVVCERYTDPRFANYERGACKECKIQCKPVEEGCPGIDELEAGFWNKTGRKIISQYITRADEMAAERAMVRRNNQFEKEQQKLEKLKQKMEEKEAKEENKKKKEEDWTAWREEKRLENEEKRAQKKQDKKDRKAAAKALKEFRKQQREDKRYLADTNKVLFAFYADLEEHYDPLCPELFLIKDNAMARKYELFKSQEALLY